MLTDAAHQSCLRLARALFAPDIRLAATDPRADHDVLAEELAGLPRARPKRLREFAAGRAAVRMAMPGLGPVVHGADRAPVWPEGVTGSISHTDTVCLAAIGRTASVRGLGIDVEEARPLDPDLIPVVCTPREAAWLRTQPPVFSKLIFSAKECAYKAQYPASRTLFGFETLELTIEDGSFQARFLQDVAPFREGDRLAGKYRMNEHHIVTGMTLRT